MCNYVARQTFCFGLAVLESSAGMKRHQALERREGPEPGIL
jgi:hypothetical protein